MNSMPRSPELVEAAAATWLSLRDRGMNAAETAEFVRWLQEDPQHTAVFTELDLVWKDFDRLRVVPANTAEISKLDGDRLGPRVRPPRTRAWMWNALGVAAAAIVLLAFVQPWRPDYTAETPVGAFQKLDLPDGSIVQLNTNTAIEANFDATERRVRIVRGEAFFSVAQDSARPFVVTAGRVAVRAVGTAFNVHHSATAIEILVTEGRVRVDDAAEGHSLLATAGFPSEPPLLIAGQRAIVSITAGSPEARPPIAAVAGVSPPEMQRTLAWQERRLEFDSATLSDVAREFNRYNQKQLVIANVALAARRFSGTFRADGYESFVRLLEDDFGVTAFRGEREIILQDRR